MDALDFQNNYLSHNFEIISKKQKLIFLVGDFNISLLNYNEYQPTNNFQIPLPLILFCRISNSQLELPVIQKPTLTILDNILFKFISRDIIFDNITATISYHWGPYIYDVHTKGSWGSPEIYHVFADSIVFKQEIYFSFLRMVRVGGGEKIGHFLWTL